MRSACFLHETLKRLEINEMNNEMNEGLLPQSVLQLRPDNWPSNITIIKISLKNIVYLAKLSIIEAHQKSESSSEKIIQNFVKQVIVLDQRL